MIFPYQSIICGAPNGQDYVLVRRPEIDVTIMGPAGLARCIGLVDTGSDQTILPRSVADELGILLAPAEGPPAVAFGGHRVQLLIGDAILTLTAGGESLAWKAPICFFDFPVTKDETVILGHAGFLEFFTATFDGKHETLMLVPNDELPALP
jgi:hypothetical protein